MLLALQIQCNLRAAPLLNYGGVEKKASKKAKSGKRDEDANYRPIMAKQSDYDAVRNLEILRANLLAGKTKGSTDSALQEIKRIDDQLALILMMTIH